MATAKRVLSVLSVLSCGATFAASEPTVTVAQGTVARWSGLAATACGLHGKRYPAVDATCYFPIDVLAKPGRYQVAVYDADEQEHLGWIEVESRGCPETAVVLEDSRYVEPQGADLERHQRERAKVLAVLDAEPSEPLFALPLASPAASLPEGDNDFCARRHFNGEEEASLHTGRDYPVALGTAVVAPEAGIVRLAEEHFMTGKSVYIDHGGGLVSEAFHLSEISVAAGDRVERGQRIGAVGESGRATGPHLHFGARWLDSRIDPAFLVDDRNQIPDLGAHPPAAK